MAQDTLVNAESVAIAGSGTFGRGNAIVDTGGNITGAGLTINGTATVTANLNAKQFFGGTSGGSGTALTSNGTISTTQRTSKVLPGSAVTGVIIGTGTLDGQELTIMNTAQATGSSITFTTAGTAAGSSNAATDVVISGLSCSKWVWDSTSALWYPVKFS